MRRLSLRAELVLALVVPAGVVVGLVAFRAEVISGRALERALGERLVAIAQSAATTLSARVTVLGPGDESTRTQKNALAKLLELKTATGVGRLLVVRTDGDTALIDTERTLPIGAPYRRAEFDRLELEAVERGEGAASLLFRGPDGRPYKSGYAPLRSEAGEVSAYVVAEAPATYTDALFDLRRRLFFVGAAGLVLLGGVALLVADLLAKPLARLSEAARAIGEGALDTSVPEGGPSEAAVLAETMRAMARSLEAREKEMQMMLAGIAHEVRNPLGGIELFGGLLAEDLENDPRRAHVDKILKELGVLSRVVNDFLEFARRRPHRPEPVSLEDLVFELTSLAAADAAAKDIVLEAAPPPTGPAVVDREAVQRAILNLLRNGIQAAQEGGRVRLEAKLDPEGNLRIAVDDDGPGVPESLRAQIFAPFFTTKQKGTGLGLALVRQTALAHGGRVEVGASPLGGARFVLTLKPDPGPLEPRAQGVSP